ncbi:MAG TPA: helix-turn-helix transcriptional regulator [Coriobacteriia bacterium]|nr:helix-turn-helix transcriptional regulator [Coriobacteriia bacterium]
MEHEQEGKWSRAVAATLRSERGVARMNQVETARKAGISRSSYRLYEKEERQPTAVQLAAISDAFGVTLVHFVAEVARRASE